MSTTLYDKTKRKYRGKYAAGYEAKRKRQIRWDKENEIVERMLEDLAEQRWSVLDVPVGTGRFLPLYKKLELEVYGVDANEDMLKIARKKKGPVNLRIGDATNLEFEDRGFDVAVCVRFLDLIDDAAMRKTVAELCRVTRERIVLTIRLGTKYVPKSNTAEHSERGFLSLIYRLGWRVVERVPIFDAGWFVLRLGRK